MSYKATRFACYVGYIVQAIVNNLTPLLFVTFQKEFGITTGELALLIAVNFCVQITVDLAAALFVDRIGYRTSVLLAHFFACSGFLLLALLPSVTDAYAGLLVATVISAIGGGLLEVVISPIVEALPSEQKASQMALLHSFYCWGQMGVVLLSSLFFLTVGIASWRILPVLWAIIPFANLILFSRVPILSLSGGSPAAVEDGGGNDSDNRKRRLFSPFFFLCIILMFCAGTTELTVSQWSSMFAETGLGVSKTVGDLLGPCAFALMMGIGRVAYGLFGKRIPIENALAFSGVLGIVAYLLTALSPFPFLSLAGCIIAGLASAILWPGTYSLGAARIPWGGTAMFALFAMAGDIGCAAGPAITGWVSNAVENGYAFFPFLSDFDGTGAGLRSGFLVTTAFPILLTAVSFWLVKKKRKEALFTVKAPKNKK